MLNPEDASYKLNPKIKGRGVASHMLNPKVTSREVVSRGIVKDISMSHG